jgi:hypothetical protein
VEVTWRFTVNVSSPSSEINTQFIQGMADRMSVSFHKYGPVEKNYPTPIHAIDSLRERLDKYEEDGNTEWLMDVASFAMIEFMHPAHTDAHYRPTESSESPGLKTWSGQDTHDPERLRKAD